MFVQLMLALTASAAAMVGGWEVQQADRFCYMWLPAAAPGGAELGLAVDVEHRPTIILSNRAWRIEPGKNYRVVAGVDGASRSRRARGLQISGNVTALAAPVDEKDFMDRFVQSPWLSYRLEEPARLGLSGANAEGRFSLGGAPAALAAVRQCVATLRRGERDITRQESKRALPRTDPYDQGPGEPPHY